MNDNGAPPKPETATEKHNRTVLERLQGVAPTYTAYLNPYEEGNPNVVTERGDNDA